MENQNIQWENWEEQTQETNEQPQVSWGEQPQQEQPQQVSWGEQPQQEQPQQVSWGEQPQQEQPQQSWGEQPQEEQPQQSWGEQPQENNEVQSPSDFEDLKTEDWERKHSFLGLLPKLKIEALLFKIDYDNNKVIQEISQKGYTPIDKDNRYKINYEGNPELINVLNSIKNIGNIRGMELHHSYLYKNSPNESILNISKGECIYNYIYFVQAEHNSGDIILDLSALNGPSEKIIDASTGILLLLPGWVPYRISKNESNQDMVAIAGKFTLPNN